MDKNGRKIRFFIPPEIFKLSDNKIILSNFSRVTIECDNNNISNIIYLDQVQTVFKLDCSCRMFADNKVVLETSLHCSEDWNVTMEPKFMINLPYISEFIEDDFLKIITADLLLNNTIHALLPELSVASSEYDAKIAIEKDTVFDLETVINQTKEDTMVYEGLSHYIYSTILNAQIKSSKFDFFSPFHWMIVISSICAILAIVMTIILHFKVRTIFILLA